MLLKDLIIQLQELYFQEAKRSISEPEILIDLFKQTDSIGAFEYCGLSKNINIEISKQTKKLVITAVQSSDTQSPDLLESGKDDAKDSLKDNFAHQVSFLTDFPRVKANVESLWGTQRGRNHLHGLIIDDRPGRDNSKVKGFPPNVYTAINNLLAIHDKTFPVYRPKTDLWDTII